MFKKNWYLFTPLLLVIVPAAIFLHYVSNVGYDWKEAKKATKFFLVSGTRYTIDYDERNFDQVKIGMDGRQVYEVMRQQPFERHENDTRWLFSLPKPGSQAYHERVVVFTPDTQGVLRVKELVRRFHLPRE